MPYVPPHLRKGFVAPPPVDYTGKVHWPTNINTHRATNVIQPSRLHSPATSRTLGTKKPALKPTAAITPNTTPVARPTMAVRKLPAKFRSAVTRHIKKEKAKGHTAKSRRGRRNKFLKTRKAKATKKTS